MSNGWTFDWDDYTSNTQQEEEDQRQAKIEEEDQRQAKIEERSQPTASAQARSSKHPPNAAYVSSDGKVSYDRSGWRLDSLGNRAFKTYGSSRSRQPQTGVGTGVSYTPPVNQYGNYTWTPTTPMRVGTQGMPYWSGGATPASSVPFPTMTDDEYQRLQNYVSGVYLPLADRAQQNYTTERDFNAQQQQFYNQFGENNWRFREEFTESQARNWRDYIEAQRRNNRDFNEGQFRDRRDFPQRQREAAWGATGRSFVPNSRLLSTG